MTNHRMPFNQLKKVVVSFYFSEKVGVRQDHTKSTKA